MPGDDARAAPVYHRSMHRLKLGRSVVVLLVVAVLSPSLARGSDPWDGPERNRVLGTWLTAESDEGRAHVKIEKVGNRYRGRIVWLEEPVYPPDDRLAGYDKIDRENPDPNLRTRPVEGLEILSGFTWDAEGREWTGGTIYDPENGKTYKAKMWITEDGDLALRGYVGFSFIGRTEIWSRVRGR